MSALSANMKKIKLNKNKLAENWNKFGAVSTLQKEVDFLRLQMTQLEDKHKEQLMLQERHHKEEIAKHKHLLKDTNTKLFPVLIFRFCCDIYILKYLT